MLDRSTAVLAFAAFSIGAAGVFLVRQEPSLFARQEQVATFDMASATSADLVTVGRPMSAQDHRQFEAACSKMMPLPLRLISGQYAKLCSCLTSAADQSMSRFDRALFMDLANKEHKQLPPIEAALEKMGGHDIYDLFAQANSHAGAAANICQSYGEFSLGFSHGPGSGPAHDNVQLLAHYRS